jgi:hypothetical protein
MHTEALALQGIVPCKLLGKRKLAGGCMLRINPERKSGLRDRPPPLIDYPPIEEGIWALVQKHRKRKDSGIPANTPS